MSYKLIIISAAQQDFEDALAYYLNNNIDTSKKFIDTIKDLYKKLEQHPHHYSFIDINRNIRGISTPKFPYLIIFKIKDTEIFILGLHNTYQDLNKILNRI